MKLLFIPLFLSFVFFTTTEASWNEQPPHSFLKRDDGVVVALYLGADEPDSPANLNCDSSNPGLVDVCDELDFGECCGDTKLYDSANHNQ